MTDVRCPMCGRDNPPDQDVCIHCEARLKPLIGATPPEPVQPAQPEEITPAEIPQDPAESPVDWLDDLRDDSQVESEDLDEPEEIDQDDAEDWITRLDTSDLPPEPDIKPESLSTGGDYTLEDSERSWDPDPEPADLPEETTPDAPEEIEIPGTGTGLLTWLTEGEAVPEGEPEDIPDAGDLPEWLQSAAGDIPDLEQELPEGEFPESDGEIPEWLKSGFGDEEEEKPATEPDTEEIPEWLESHSDRSPEPLPDETEQADQDVDEIFPFPAPTELPETPAEELEYSLDPIPAEASTETDALVEGEAADEIADTFSEELPPDRLPELEEGLPEPVEETQDEPDWFDLPVEPAMTADGGELPDWLEGLQPVPDEPAADLAADAIPFIEAGAADEPPDWLADLEAKTPDVSAQLEGLPPTLEFDEAPPPEVEAEVDAEEIPFETPFLAETPGWIADIPAEDDLPEEEDVEEAGPETELAPAELPGWLRAIRPVEAVAPITPPLEEEVSEVEEAGPLAGLEGVLAVEPEITQTGVPASFSAQVDVTANQEKQAALLKNLVESEAEPQFEKPRAAVIQPQRVLRWLIALGLFLVVIYPIVIGGQSLPLPALDLRPDVWSFRSLIDALPPESQVVVAADYQPALSGELDAVSATVLDHLRLQGARLTFVSTSPTGPALVERLLNDPSGVGPRGWDHGDHYVNLGYLPGGSAGLLNFAIQPQQTLPSAFKPDGMPESGVWTTRPLRGVGSLTDFDMVVVLVDTPDTARAWIEQVQPQLASVPLMMVASAQADPMIRPYYEANPQQVAGLLTGLAGGAAYGQGRSLEGSRPSSSYWTPFSYGLIFAEVVILIGVVYSFAVGLIRPRARTIAKGKDEE